MNTQIERHAIRTAALTLSYHIVPWDTQIVGAPVAQISELELHDPQQAEHDCEPFFEWCRREGVALCATRLTADRMGESMFLEARGFRFIELNYLPQLRGLDQSQFVPNDVQVEPAADADREDLAIMAGQVFPFGRFHQDPRIAPTLGDRRYRSWMLNAFSNPQQHVFKCLRDGVIVAFFVVEFPAPAQCFWSLTGLAPGLSGKGLGRKVWQAMLNQHSRDGIETVSTSISSHNVPVMNLYVSLGFRFPQPSITLQWRPSGAGILN